MAGSNKSLCHEGHLAFEHDNFKVSSPKKDTDENIYQEKDLTRSAGNFILRNANPANGKLRMWTSGMVAISGDVCLI